MNVGAVLAGASAMAVFGWSSHSVDARFNLGMRLYSPVAGIIAFITVLILAFARLRTGLHGGVAVLLGVAAVCALTDIQTGYILDIVTIPALCVVLLCGLAQHALADAFAGSAACAAALLLLHIISRGRGMGMGDVKLALCIGAAFGVRAGLVALCVAFILGGSVAAMLLVLGNGRRDTEMRFGPFLALGSALVAVVNP